ncbi:hypothetical protein CNAG_02719 [Cryptococcus neoformans var. grubii H99]|uniref:Uncharacterized protein n=1 Tax=Cryptococcus neoformans (strain H99 / ATCC 208821 / CBS 10515 / FGSC 9487) TaxID=235443 RepID=J9VQK5_CRYN9|nr:hypothetical protein CNAG_02719 [Cryptococcus neoformans var. grubii H99]AFR93970.2 hypothetical protein CNAG_02719 [Cryptococcus neoformans var. grubii H99]AUB23565.1 hypothetical protein CKF44_02719 [Cryptococcus neoformans var. grubii]|eukprot:XP_012047925.1 hypothetical protein CNAG_02719 [Cryptococcus neoformans var. grubii H99]
MGQRQFRSDYALSFRHDATMLLGNTIEKVVGAILERASVIQRHWRGMVQCHEPKTCSLVLSEVFPRSYSFGSTSFRTALLPLNPLSPFLAERKDWYDFPLLSQVGDPTKPVSYKAEREAMINALLAAGVFSSKSTHENRRTGARLAGKRDMAVDDTARAGGWTPATLEMTYLSALPCKGIRRRDCCNEELELLTAETARLICWSQNHSDKISKALAEWETAKKDWLTYETQLEASQMTARTGDGELGDHVFVCISSQEHAGDSWFRRPANSEGSGVSRNKKKWYYVTNYRSSK